MNDTAQEYRSNFNMLVAWLEARNIFPNQDYTQTTDSKSMNAGYPGKGSNMVQSAGLSYQLHQPPPPTKLNAVHPSPSLKKPK